MLLPGRTALITGSTQGIGKAIAKRMAAEGANVIVAGRSEGRGEAVASDIRESGGSAIYVRCDVGVEHDVENAVATAVSTFGSLTDLVNNAAPTDQLTTGGDNTVLDLSTEDWDRMIRVGLTSTFWACKYSVRAMLEAGHGSIINIVTVSAIRGEAGLDGYTAGKGGMLALTRSLAVEFGAKQIRSNAIAPGYIPGDMPASRAILDNPVMSRAFRSAQLLPAWGAPDDIAAAATWLASDEARFVTGAVLPVDGGATAYSRMPDFQSEEFQQVFAEAQEKYAVS